jgi:hypothetical protein
MLSSDCAVEAPKVAVVSISCNVCHGFRTHNLTLVCLHQLALVAIVVCKAAMLAKVSDT